MSNVIGVVLTLAMLLQLPPIAAIAEPVENQKAAFKRRVDDDAPKIRIGENHAKIREALLSEYSFTIEKMPLEKFIDRMADHYNVPIILDHDGLNREDINPSTQVSLSIPPVTLRSALNLILDPLDLDFVYHREVLYVTTKSQVDLIPVAMVYELGTSYSNQNVAELLQKTADAQKEDAFPKPVVHLLTRSAAGEPDQLFVRANKRTHHDVQVTLEMLRELNPQ